MGVEMTVLTVLAVFAASLWIPFIVGVNTAPARSLPSDAPDGFVRAANWRLHRPWVQRAYRAHQNLLEQAIPFALLVLIFERVEGFSSFTAWTCAAFLGLRLAHAVGYVTGWTGLSVRPILFTGGWLCCFIIAAVALAA